MWNMNSFLEWIGLSGAWISIGSPCAVMVATLASTGEGGAVLASLVSASIAGLSSDMFRCIIARQRLSANYPLCGPAVSNALMAMPRAFRIGWVHITLIGFFLLAGNCVWFYFHGWQAIQRPAQATGDAYPPIWIDYCPSHAQSLITSCGLTLFFGGLIFGRSRWIYKLARRFLSPSPRVR